MGGRKGGREGGREGRREELVKCTIMTTIVYLRTSVGGILDGSQQRLVFGVEGHSEGTVDDPTVHLKKN